MLVPAGIISKSSTSWAAQARGGRLERGPRRGGEEAGVVVAVVERDVQPIDGGGVDTTIDRRRIVAEVDVGRDVRVVAATAAAPDRHRQGPDHRGRTRSHGGTLSHPRRARTGCELGAPGPRPTW
jgi:hypothetical protein